MSFSCKNLGAFQVSSPDRLDVRTELTQNSVFDFYFLAGPTPKEAAQQYAHVVGLPAMHTYWGLGFHQCKYGYRDVYQVAEVVANYSAADIPLETMWTDIDYMDLRRVFTLDPERFPLDKVQALVSTLHERQQHYIVMVDPAVAYRDYPPFNDGVSSDSFLKISNGSVYKGVVWPGVAAFPDWFAPSTQNYWNEQFASFFNADTGVNIDALWIDMNEASNFCNWPCTNPEAFAVQNDDPPAPPPVRNGSRPAIPGFPASLQPPATAQMLRRQSAGSKMGLLGRNLIDPPYMINNAAGSLSNKTVASDIVHYGGYAEYDVHNLYGTMMSAASRDAMLNRRPGRRPLVITRSTFAGAGRQVGHWLGDNLSDWWHLKISIAELLAFAALYQVPMVGSDVCGFGGNTTEMLCARWATLGAFSTFYRNHDDIAGIPQEFYRWPLVAEAARNAIGARYQLLDYIYTALHRQTIDGTPLLNPLFFNYPSDANTFPIDLQYFYGDSILVSPVTDENSTSVRIYLPNDLFYDFWTHEPVRGTGGWVNLTDVPFTTIPLHVRAGAILPLRASSANTTTVLRTRNFELLIAADEQGRAEGSLYLDEGDAIEQPLTSEIKFVFEADLLNMTGTFGYPTNVTIEKITLLSAGKAQGKREVWNWVEGAGVERRESKSVQSTSIPLTGPVVVSVQ